MSKNSINKLKPCHFINTLHREVAVKAGQLDQCLETMNVSVANYTPSCQQGWRSPDECQRLLLWAPWWPPQFLLLPPPQSQVRTHWAPPGQALCLVQTSLWTTASAQGNQEPPAWDSPFRDSQTPSQWQWFQNQVVPTAPRETKYVKMAPKPRGIP